MPEEVQLAKFMEAERVTPGESGITPLNEEQTAAEEQQAGRERYPVRVLVGLDQFVNVTCDGKPDETISSRAARAAVSGKWWGKALSRFLDCFQRDHGADAEAGDLERAQQAGEIELKSGTLNQ